MAPLLLALLLALPGPESAPRAAQLAAVGGVSAPAVRPGPPGEAGYVFGVFPYMPPLSLDRIFAPIVGGLSREIGRPVHLRTKPNFEAFSAELSVGGYDLAFMHPFLYVTAAAAYGYVPLVRVDEPLRLVFLANAGDDGGLRSIRDLAGRTLALPGPLAAVSEMAKLALNEIGLRPGADVQVQHYQTKMSCVQALAIGHAAACGLPAFALAQLDLGARDRFRIFDERSLAVGLVLAVNQRVDAAERRRLGTALVRWSASPEGRAVMAHEGWPGFALAEERDFDPVRAMIARSQRLALQQR